MRAMASMCYKPFMRKWMRDRMKRRKKTEDSTQGSEKAQAPLQPAYFEADANQSAASEHEDRSAPETEGTAEDSEQVSPQGSEAEASGPQASSGRGTEEAGQGEGRRRRRRRRSKSPASRSRNARPQSESASGAALQPSAPAPEMDSAAAPELMPSAAASSTAAAAAQARPPKGIVVLAIGLPGSGKSSWFKRHNIHPLSSDLLRELLFDDPSEQRFQDLIFSNLRSMLKARLIARRPMNYVDATNLTPHDRHSWIKLAKDYGYEVQAVFFDVPVEVCLERNQKRHRVVPEDVMRRFSGKLRPPTFEEGFSKITVVRVKKKG